MNQALPSVVVCSHGIAVALEPPREVVQQSILCLEPKALLLELDVGIALVIVPTVGAIRCSSPLSVPKIPRDSAATAHAP